MKTSLSANHNSQVKLVKDTRVHHGMIHAHSSTPTAKKQFVIKHYNQHFVIITYNYIYYEYNFAACILVKENILCIYIVLILINTERWTTRVTYMNAKIQALSLK